MSIASEPTTAELRQRVEDSTQQLTAAQQALKQRLDEQCAAAAKQLRQAEAERDDLVNKLEVSTKRAVGKKSSFVPEASRDDMVKAAVELVADNPPGLEPSDLLGLVKSRLKGKKLTGAFRHLETYLAKDGRIALDAAGRYVLAVKPKHQVA